MNHFEKTKNEVLKTDSKKKQWENSEKMTQTSPVVKLMMHPGPELWELCILAQIFNPCRPCRHQMQSRYQVSRYQIH